MKNIKAQIYCQCMRGIHQWVMYSPLKEPVMWKTIPSHEVIMYITIFNVPSHNIMHETSWNLMSVYEFLSATLAVNFPNSKVHGANMGPTWDLSAPDGPHVGPMNLAIRVVIRRSMLDRCETFHLIRICWQYLCIVRPVGHPCWWHPVILLLMNTWIHITLHPLRTIPQSLHEPIVEILWKYVLF